MSSTAATILAARKKQFKKGLSAEDGRKNRLEAAIQLRKDKRQEGLQKKRLTSHAAEAPTDAATESDDKKVGGATRAPVKEVHVHGLEAYIAGTSSSRAKTRPDVAPSFRGARTSAGERPDPLFPQSCAK